MSEYPEHQRQSLVLDEAQAIGQFLDEGPYTLGEWYKPEGYHEARLMPVSKTVQAILAEYFGIDLNKIEAEKRQMLDAMRGPVADAGSNVAYGGEGKEPGRYDDEDHAAWALNLADADDDDD